MTTTDRGLIFANLVDFDTLLRAPQRCRRLCREPRTFGRAPWTTADRAPATDLLVVTADHGNDPTTPSTDHAREYVPVFLTGQAVRPGVDIGTRQTFADLGQTIAELFGVGPLDHGSSFLSHPPVKDNRRTG